eukprot:748277-Hanusia_phi.AAC.2
MAGRNAARQGGKGYSQTLLSRAAGQRIRAYDQDEQRNLNRRQSGEIPAMSVKHKRLPSRVWSTKPASPTSQRQTMTTISSPSSSSSSGIHSQQTSTLPSSPFSSSLPSSLLSSYQGREGKTVLDVVDHPACEGGGE